MLFQYIRYAHCGACIAFVVAFFCKTTLSQLHRHRMGKTSPVDQDKQAIPANSP